MIPKRSVPKYPVPVTTPPSALIPFCTVGQIKYIKIPTKRYTTVDMIGTNLVPPKNDNAFGSSIL